MNKIFQFLLFALLGAGPATAHDLWLERDEDGYRLLQGHRHSSHAGTENVPYAPTIVRGALCLDTQGAVKRLTPGKTYPVRIAGNCVVLLVSLSSGYWSKTPWETKNVPKEQAPGAISSWLSEESVKRIERWTGASGSPLTDGLELTPLTDPLALKPGDKLVVLVTENRKPRAGIAVAYDGDTRGASGEDGRIAIRLRHGGTQLIAASLETPLGDGKADSLIRTTALHFDLPR